LQNQTIATPEQELETMNEPMDILLIEDNAGDARLIREMLLKNDDYDSKLEITTTLADGLRQLSEDVFDAVLLDLSLPDSQGVETLHRVVAQAPDMAVVVLTGFGDQRLGVQAVQAGAQDYLVKGDTDAKLITRAVRYAIERQRVQTAMHKQSLELAAIEERQRLARELHDSVSQTLFTCRNMSEAAILQFEQNPPRSLELMQESNRLTGSALSEMRVLLLELRPTSLTKVGLKQLFEGYAEMFRYRRGLDIMLELDDIAPLIPEAQIAFYRIMQEALNNIVKHAGAQRVKVSVQKLGGDLHMLIQDDGTGFDLEEVAATSLGIGIMTERAEDIDAEIRITSAPGAGTRIDVRWHIPDDY